MPTRLSTPLNLVLVSLAAVLIACQPEAVEEAPAYPDLVVVNADVYTVDDALPRAEAFAVRDGRFTTVGTSAEIRELAGPDTNVIDAGGVTIIPGLVDGHTHLLMGSGLAVGVDLTDIESKDEWLQIIRDKAEELPGGAWILGGAWNHNLGDGVLPTKEMLDSVAPDNPVWLTDIDYHTAWANSLAIELAGITADTPVPPGGEILLDAASGEPSGIFLEGAAYLFADAPGMAEATDPVTGIKAAIRMANRLGITSVHDMSDNVDSFLDVYDSGAMTLRIWSGALPDYPADESADEILASVAADRDRVAAHVSAEHGPLYEIGYVKLVIDGVLSTHTAMMKAPYSDRPDVEVEPFASKETLTAMITASHRQGFPVAVHAIGDEGVSWVLDAFAASPGVALPDRVEHIEVVTPDDIARFASQGVAASMQPHHATCCVGDYVIDRIGRERLPNAYAWRSMLDADVDLALSSDWPTSPLNPLIQIADTLHRETRIDGVAMAWDEGGTLSFDETLHAYTQGAADLTSWSDQVGSISAGKFADFVMLDQRLAEPVDRTIEDRSVAATYLGGRQVYP